MEKSGDEYMSTESMLPRPSFGFIKNDVGYSKLDPGPLVALKIRVTVQCGVAHFEISLPRLPLGPGACIDDLQNPRLQRHRMAESKEQGPLQEPHQTVATERQIQETRLDAPQEDTTPVPLGELTKEAPSAQDSNPHSKPCDMCQRPRDVLIRCQIDETKKWHFVCTGKCWQQVSGGQVEGTREHPLYRYGGMWKNKHDAVSAKIKGKAKAKNH
jgi:hypothetical protein